MFHSEKLTASSIASMLVNAILQHEETYSSKIEDLNHMKSNPITDGCCTDVYPIL